MKKHFWLILILIVGIFLRYYHNTEISLWHDEAFSALLIKYSWSEMMYRISLDVHPPMYYVMLRIWHYVFGDSLLSLRSFSVLFSAGTIWAGWLFVKAAFPGDDRSVRHSSNRSGGLWARNPAIITAALLALNPFQIQYATEARMYTMGAFFTLLAAYFLVKILYYHARLYDSEELKMPRLSETLSNRKKLFYYYAGFTVSVIIMIYTHYYLLFAAAALCLYGLIYLFSYHRFNWKTYFPLLTAYSLVLIAYLPWLKIFLFQYRQVGAGYWIPPLDKWSIPSTLYTLLVGFGYDVKDPAVHKLLLSFSALVIFILFRFLRNTQSFHKWLVLMAAVAPFAGALLFWVLAKITGGHSSVFLVRYFIFTGAFLSVIVAIWLSQLKFRFLSLLLVGGYLLVNLWAFVGYWQDLQIKHRPGMAGAAKYLKTHMGPGDKLYVGSSFMFFNLKYYLSQFLSRAHGAEPRDKSVNRPLLFSGEITDVKQLPHFAGTAILTNDDLLPDFNRDVKTGDTVWLVWTNGFGASKPEIPPTWAQISEKEYPEVRPYLGTSVYVSELKVN